MKTVTHIIAALAVFAGAMLSNAQEAKEIKFSDLIGGKGLTPSYKLATLPDDYKAVHIRIQSTNNPLESLTSMWMFMMPMSGESASNRESFSALNLLDCAWTKGDTVYVVYDAISKAKQYLIVYQATLEDAVVSSGNDKVPNVEEFVFKLRLVDVNSIQSLMPEPEINKTKILNEAKKRQPNVDKAKAISNLKQIATAAMIFCADNDDVFPFVNSTAECKAKLMPYMKNAEIWNTGIPGIEIRYNINVGGVAQSAIDNISEMPLFFESAPRPDGTRLVAYTDGHVGPVSADNWPKIEALLKKKFKRNMAKPEEGPTLIR